MRMTRLTSVKTHQTCALMLLCVKIKYKAMIVFVHLLEDIKEYSKC